MRSGAFLSLTFLFLTLLAAILSEGLAYRHSVYLKAESVRVKDSAVIHADTVRQDTVVDTVVAVPVPVADTQTRFRRVFQ